MAEAPTVKESRSMGDVVKKANLGVKQHGITACTLCQVPGCREKDNDGCFLWLRMIPNRRGWLGKWTTAMIVERYRTSCTLSQGSWWALCTRSLEVPNDTEEGERVEERLMRVDLSSESSRR